MDEAPWPLKPFRQGFLTFARFHDLQDHFGPNLPIKRKAERLVAGFLDDGWFKLGIERLDARNHFSDLSRQAFEKLFAGRGLQPYGLSGAQIAWRSEEHTSELQSLMRSSYAVFCLKKKKKYLQTILQQE